MMMLRSLNIVYKVQLQNYMYIHVFMNSFKTRQKFEIFSMVYYHY